MNPENSFDPEIVRSILDKMGRDNRSTSIKLATLSFAKLYEQLNPREIKTVHKLLELRPDELGFYGPYVGMADPGSDLLPIKEQRFTRSGIETTIRDQYLPKQVWAAFQKVQAALYRDTGSRLMVESGYRSPAHQAITFLTYLEMFNFNIVYVASGVALPGYSQHGDPTRTAVDVINQDGLPTDEQPQLFAYTLEYDWLIRNAAQFDFHLSYPEGNQYGIKFEPWHWRYQP